MILPLLAACLLPVLPLQPPPPPSAAATRPAETSTRTEKENTPLDGPPVVTHHSAQVGGTTLNYTVTTGMMPLKNPAGEIEARIFFVAYTRDGVPAGTKRPLLFSFNGGPGSASVWLHLGAFGPKRVRLKDDGGMPAPPFQLVDNAYSLLDLTDLVFIDPVGTGYSRAARPELGAKYWSVSGDIGSVGEFIRMYLSRYQRWTSPLFLAGESYGGTRAAGLAGYLVDKGILFNGVICISPAFSFQTLDFNRGNDLPYVTFLPTYAATAWYHKKLSPDLLRDLPKTLAEVRKWAETDYTIALAKGDALTSQERQAVVARLARYTGLEPRYIENSNLRVDIFHFCKELLRSEKRTVGRLDSRFQGIDSRAIGDSFEHDPSEDIIRPPFTATFNDYVRGELNYISDAEYYILGGGITGRWDWGSAGNGYVDTSDGLRDALIKNPYMKIFVAEGYYDLACPFGATQFVLEHLGIEPALRKNITVGEYEAGHMVYIHQPSLARLKADLSAFIQNALAAK